MTMADGASKLTAPPRPTLSLPPRSSIESFFSGGASFSPGPMTLVSNFFSENHTESFSQLLAGAMASPIAAATQKMPNFSVENNSSKELNQESSELGFRQNRPVNLVVAQPPPMFAFQPGLSPLGFPSPGFFSPLQSPFGMSHQQALAQVTAQAALSQSYMQTQQPESQSCADPLPHHQPNSTTNTAPQQVDTVSVISEPESSAMESSEVSQPERKVVPLSVADKPANDGYNWRKYGQKQVKASEYPRSYYRCTHPNCRVTKKVERNLEGKITEIIYKGQHDHELPEPNKRTKNNVDRRPSMNSQSGPELGLPLEREMNRSIEVSHSAPEGEQGLPQLTSVPLPDPSSNLEMIVVEPRQEDDDEPNPKRRNIEAEPTAEKSSLHKTVTEPKIVLQTRSEVDLLDDGYKWRKYGQKVVKGNPHPRSYYKCTFAGCNVRKHVERSSADPKAVITTYEGKHNHDVPAPRKSNNSPPELKPQKVTAKKRAPSGEMEFNHDQRHLLLQLKEEHIQA